MAESNGSELPGSFHPLVRSWFAERYGEPTPVQAEAWPLIAGGGHVLASAPTGSGKTLTAFLGALSRFASGDYPSEGLSVLYVSPLKALNEDVRLNLLQPARELGAWFSARGQAFPRLRILSRSGDTPQSERRSMLKAPPAILCTTPESLAILLASRSGLSLLSAVRLLILDEVHAVLGTKRGSALACSVGRLALVAGEFQRVALSATVRPFEEAARFVGGRRLVRGAGGEDGAGGLPGVRLEGRAARFEPRAVAVVAPPASKRYELSVAWPAAPIRVRPPSAGPGESEPDEATGRYDAVVSDLAERIAGERATIVFADSRRRTERLAAMLNEACGEGTAWAHHGSLSRDVRKAVETRLKEGRLRCVVATGTLELGIDVGSVDLVAMAGAPARADQLLQRAGRAGHGVGLASRAVVYPFHGLDLLAAAAAVGAALEADIDEVRPPRCPLDVLAQALLSMVLFGERRLDELFDEVRSFYPFEALARPDFDAVVGMLSGRYSGSRVKELSGRVYLDAERSTIKAREGAAMLLYSSGGSIPDRGYYAMRLAGDGGKIGELDEEFVFERRVGNSFSFGSQAWRIVDIGDEAVTVAPLDRDADFMPFWKADKAPRGSSVCLRMLDACADYQVDPAGFASRLAALGFLPGAADALADFLGSQARAQGGSPLPSRAIVPVEIFRDPGKKGDSTAIVL
ncbi:MAG: DEAD/DEAH box helicase, partial [Spirochaetes bacterium]|nr:DEAD/DEAH box helicase [Spirochaetota bacterium]